MCIAYIYIIYIPYDLLSWYLLVLYTSQKVIPPSFPILYGHLLNPDSLLRPRCVPALETSIKEVDAAYDSCNEAWARGEADKFRSQSSLTQLLDTFGMSKCSWQN